MNAKPKIECFKINLMVVDEQPGIIMIIVVKRSLTKNIYHELLDHRLRTCLELPSIIEIVALLLHIIILRIIFQHLPRR